MDNYAKDAVEAAEKPLSEKEPIYIVSGFPRSGTSMMMRCLVEGGLDGMYNSADISHLQLEAETGYMPNPHGFYETGRGVESWYFPSTFAGRLIKMELASTASMAPGQRYRIILMWRDPKAVERSLESYTAALKGVGKPKPQLWKALESVKAGRYAEMMIATRLHLRNRKDVEQLIEVGYEKVLEDPEAFFKELKEVGKWPIDVEKAAAVPDGQWNRSGSG